MGAELGTLLRTKAEPTILAGRTFAALPKEQRHPIGSQVLGKVRRNNGIMRQVDRRAINASIREGRSVGVIGDGLLSYAQIWSLPRPEDSGLPKGTMEVGTWVSFVSGMGPVVIPPAAELAVTEFDAQMAVALVRKGNAKAHDSLLDLGAEPVADRPSDYIPGNPMMTVFKLPVIKL